MFYTISGYLLFSKFRMPFVKHKSENWKVVKKYIIHITKIYAVWSLLYILLSLAEWLRHTADFSLFAFIKEQLVLLLFKAPYYHLWYLLALIYAVPLCAVIICYCSNKKLIAVIITFLFCAGLLHYSYAWVGVYSHPVINRFLDIFEGIFNAAFIAVPFLLIGYLSLNYNTEKHNKYLLGTVLSFIAWMAEISIIYFLISKKANLQFTFSGLFFSYYMLNYLLSSNFHFKHKRMRDICRKCSLFIYCVHPMVIYFFQLCCDDEGIIRFLVVASVSMVLATGYYFISYYKKRRQKI